MRITLEIPNGDITNCYACPFGRYNGYICNVDKELCNFRCILLDSLGFSYPHKVQSAKPVRPKFCPIKRISKQKREE